MIKEFVFFFKYYYVIYYFFMFSYELNELGLSEHNELGLLGKCCLSEVIFELQLVLLYMMA